MNKKALNGLMLLTVGFIILLSYNTIVPREKAVFDGEKNDFKLTIQDATPSGNPDELFTTDLKITNAGSSGYMYVQCSIFDLSLFDDWIVPNMRQGVDSVISYLPMSENCGINEPHTQTAKVYLLGGANGVFRFNMLVPSVSMEEPILYCGAYEQCWTNATPDPFYSDEVYVPFTIGEDDTPPTLYPGVACVQDSDCSLYNDAKCINGACVDVEDVPSIWIQGLDIHDDKIKAWLKERQIFVIVAGIFFVILGMFTVYKEPKRL